MKRTPSNSIRLGRTFEEAMWEVADRLDIAEFNFFATSLAVQRETGGNIAETLGNLSSLIRSRHQMKKKVRALSSEARASAWIVGSLPFAMFLILLLINRDYVMALINEDRGLVLLGIGGGFILVPAMIYILGMAARVVVGTARRLRSVRAPATNPAKSPSRSRPET